MDRPNRVNAQLRQLPAVDRLVARAREATNLSRWSALAAARAELGRVRSELGAGGEVPSPETLVERVRARARRLESPSPRRVINATGVVLHTNLGRAPLSERALRAALEVGAGYSDLELDLESGRRGSRLDAVSELLCVLSGAADALVVNNNAAALLLAVDTLAAGREVVLSRGELVEIGGSFRVPDIMASSRARLREVGTTNRTHLEDYESAIGPDTGLLLKVHRSNFEIRGFTKEVSLRELAALGRERGIPVVEDRGSGTFVDLRPAGIPEPEVTTGLADGADLVLFSGDKLLGGPQAGIVLGDAARVRAMRGSPLARAVRVDKLTLAALYETLRALCEAGPEADLPVLRMLYAPVEELRARAEQLRAALEPQGWAKLRLDQTGSVVGGGALPELEIPGVAVRVEVPPTVAVDTVAAALRAADPPVVVRIQHDAIVLDPRTLADADVEPLASAFGQVLDGLRRRGPV